MNRSKFCWNRSPKLYQIIRYQLQHQPPNIFQIAVVIVVIVVNGARYRWYYPGISTQRLILGLISCCQQEDYLPILPIYNPIITVRVQIRWYLTIHIYISKRNHQFPLYIRPIYYPRNVPLICFGFRLCPVGWASFYQLYGRLQWRIRLPLVYHRFISRFQGNMIIPSPSWITAIIINSIICLTLSFRLGPSTCWWRNCTTDAITQCVYELWSYLYLIRILLHQYPHYSKID